jgi:anti-anti-sigma factor
MAPLRYLTSHVAGATAVHFRGPTVVFSAEDRRALADELAALAERSGRPELHLDLRHIVFVNVATLQLLLRLRARLRSVGRRLRLCHVRPEVAEAFAATRLDRLFGIDAGAGAEPIRSRG